MDAREIAARQRAAGIGYLEAWMDDVLGAAQRDAPIEEGTLRASGDRETHDHGNTVEIVGYFSTPYAARQHEELDWHHPLGGHAKYLERPFKDHLPSLEPGLARVAAAVLR